MTNLAQRNAASRAGEAATVIPFPVSVPPQQAAQPTVPPRRTRCGAPSSVRRLCSKRFGTPHTAYTVPRSHGSRSLTGTGASLRRALSPCTASRESCRRCSPWRCSATGSSDGTPAPRSTPSRRGSPAVFAGYRGPRLTAQYSLRVQEHLGVLFIDSRNRIIEEREIFMGTLHNALVSTRAIARLALIFMRSASSSSTTIRLALCQASDYAKPDSP